MDDTIQVSDELKQIANTICEAAKLVGDASKIYEQAFQSFTEVYLGKAQNEETLLTKEFVQSLNVLEHFYGQATYYVNYCLENLSTQDKEEADSYNQNNINMV